MLFVTLAWTRKLRALQLNKRSWATSLASKMTPLFVGSFFCQLTACTSLPPAPPVQNGPAITVYQVNSHPAVSQLNYEQIASIGIDCNNRDNITAVLESRVGKLPQQPEQLSAEQRRLNSVARVKLWSLRTYCPGTYTGPVVTSDAKFTPQALPERFEERFESRTTAMPNGQIETYRKSVRVEEPGIELKQVRLGEIVREEHLLPIKLPNLTYNQMTCRWFKDVAQFTVIACRIQTNVWQVVDKF
jgi:hypothetical protein